MLGSYQLIDKALEQNNVFFLTKYISKPFCHKRLTIVSIVQASVSNILCSIFGDFSTFSSNKEDEKDQSRYSEHKRCKALKLNLFVKMSAFDRLLRNCVTTSETTCEKGNMFSKHMHNSYVQSLTGWNDNNHLIHSNICIPFMDKYSATSYKFWNFFKRYLHLSGTRKNK